MLIRTSAGLEISGKDLRVAVVRSAMGKLRLMHSFEAAGFVDLPVDEQRSTFVKLIKRHKLPPSHVFLTLPRDRGIVRQIEFPVEVQEKLKSAVALQIETLCPWPVEEIYWDFAQDTVKKGGKTVTATVVMIPRVALDPWIEFFKSVQLPLSGASLSSVSCAHGVQALWADATPTVVLDCEDTYVEGSLVQGSRLASITQSSGEPAGAAKAAVERLLSMGRVSSPENARLIVYGSGAASLELAGRIALPLENAKPESSDRFGAIASALIGAKKTAFESNLVPRELRYRRSQLQLIPTYVLAGLTILLGITMAVRHPYQSVVYGSQLEDEIRKVAPAAKQVSTQEAELNKLSEKYRALAGHLQNRDYNLEAMRELSRSLPATAWLTNYTYQDGAISVSGFAPSASEVQKALEDTALFKDVQFTSSVTRDASGKDRFTMKASIEAPR